jgi:two-component system sensor histidine kinase SenX3
MVEPALVVLALAAAANTVWLWRLAGRRERAHRLQIDRLQRELSSVGAGTDDAARTFQASMDSLSQGIVLVEGDDLIGYANIAAVDLLGRLPDAVSGLVPVGLQRLVRQARDQGTRTESDFEHGAPVRVLRVAATPFPDHRRVLLAITDVTDRTRIDAMRRDFAAAASHELKTPVAAILASAEALQMAMERDPGAAQRFAAQIEASGKQLSRLVSDLLDLSRLEAESVDSEAVRLDEVGVEEVGRAAAAAEAAGIELSLSGGPVAVLGNRQDVALAIRNLIDNALRYTPRGGRVSLTVSERGGKAELVVADTGEGIPQRDLPRIFERFYRVDAARSRSKGGTGLGLAIVKHVVERHGGTVSAQSELGMGSTFRLQFPAARVPLPDPENPGIPKEEGNT